jgi:hypothetical protein
MLWSHQGDKGQDRTSLALATMSINPLSYAQQTDDDIDLFGEDDGVVPARALTSYASLTTCCSGSPPS